MISRNLFVLAGLLVLSACSSGGSDTTPTPRPAVNVAPVVNAGVDATIRLPADSVALDGTVNDDGLPSGVVVSTAWTVASGPAGATFADANAVDTTVTFVSEGTYVLELTADDTALQSTDSVEVVVEAAPVLTIVSVTPATVSLLSGGAQTFSASGTDQYGDSIAVNVTWSATGGTIDAAGDYTAGAVLGDFTVTATDGAVVGTAGVTISASPPTANAGGPYVGVEGASVALDGSGSTDTNNDIVDYDWDLDNDGAYDDANGVNTTFAAAGSGVFTIGLQVTDADGASNIDSTTVTISNVAPTANAGGPYSGDQGADIVLDGSASSDPGNDIVTYEWDLDNDGAFDNAMGVSATFNSAATGTFTIGLRVTDDDGASNSATATVTVVNAAPTADAGPDQPAVAQGATVTLDGSASSDPGGDALTYAWTLTAVPVGSAAALSDATAIGPTFDTDLVGSYVAQLVVNDGTDDSLADTVTITVGNVAPTANAGPDQPAVLQGATVTLDGSASSDSGGDALTYAWTLTSIPVGSAAALSDATAIGPTFDTDLVGSYVAQLVVNDGTDDSLADTVTITVGNVAPTANAGPDQPAVLQGATVTLDGSASSDPGGDALTYAWTLTSVPVGSAAALSDAAAVGPTFDTDLAGSYVAQLVVNDGTDDSLADTVTITVGNVAPTANAGPDQPAVLQGATVTLDGSASSDPGGDALTYAWTLTSTPGGSAAVLSDAAAVGPTFDADLVGSYVAQLVVNDGTDDSLADTVTITVGNVAPTANAGPDQPAVLQGATVTLDGSASSDPGGDALTYAWTLTSTPGGSAAVLSDATAEGPTFDTDLVGSYVAQLVVNDGTDDSLADTVTITVVDVAPIANAGGPYSGDQGADIALDGSASSDGSGIATYEWDLDNDGAFDNATGVNATFNSAAAGVFTVGLRVTDNDGTSATTTVDVTVNDSAPAAPVGLSASGEDGQVVLDWDNNTEPDLDGYVVHRSTTQGGLYTPISPLLIASDFIDGPVTNGTTYFYVITARDTAGIPNVSANSAEVAVTPNGPVHAFWTFDEGAGLTTVDTVTPPDDGSGTVNDTGPDIWVAGVTGGVNDFALDFDGIDDHVVIDNTQALNITGKAISMHAWVFPRNGGVLPSNGGGDSRQIISKRTDAGGSEVFAMRVRNYRLHFRLDGQGMISSHILVLNEWVHVAMVYDGADMRIYINGVLDAATPVLKSDPIDASSRAVHLGMREGEARHFDGIIDDVQILNSVQLPGAVTPPVRGAGLLFFEDITTTAGTAGPADGGHGVMFAEVDNDSDPDYYLTNNNGSEPGLRSDFFFDNTSGVAFTNVAAARGIDDEDGGSNGAVWADLDNDGDYDLVNGTRWDIALPDGGVPTNDNVFRNNGPASPGLFTEVTPASMLAVATENRAVTALDMDGDGWLDIYGKGGPTGVANEAFLNDGVGNFAFSSHVGGDLSTADGKEGITDTDYDGDGDIDILAANRDGEFVILQNQTVAQLPDLPNPGIFTQISPTTLLDIVHTAGDSVTTADVDNDGDLDLLLVGAGTGRLYHRRSTGLYTLEQSFQNVDGFMGGFADLDNDGDQDLVFAGEEKVFENIGGGNFTPGQSVPISGIADARAIAFADIDSDGDLDFAITAKLSRNLLVLNSIDSGNWLRVELVSPQGQAGAFGAKVSVRRVPGDGGALVGMREAKGNNGYLAQDEQVLHFGLGAIPSVDVVVDWVDGTTTTCSTVLANKRILIAGVVCPP